MSAQPPRLVVFDLDGTLVDSHPAIVGCFHASVARLGLPPLEEAAITALIGLPLALMFDRLLPDLPPAERAQAVEAYKRAYADFDRRHTRPFLPVLDVVRSLRSQGVATAIATSKSRVGLRRTVDEHHLDPLFDATLSNDDVQRKKPHPEMLLGACDLVGVEPSRAVMVGDTSFDVQMGVAAGSRAVGVTWGAHDTDRLRAAGAHHVVHDPPQLGRCLEP